MALNVFEQHGRGLTTGGGGLVIQILEMAQVLQAGGVPAAALGKQAVARVGAGSGGGPAAGGKQLNLGGDGEVLAAHGRGIAVHSEQLPEMPAIVLGRVCVQLIQHPGIDDLAAGDGFLPEDDAPIIRRRVDGGIRGRGVGTAAGAAVQRNGVLIRVVQGDGPVGIGV